MNIQIYVHKVNDAGQPVKVKGKDEYEIVDFNVRAALLECFFIDPDEGVIFATFRGLQYRIVYTEDTYKKLYQELNG